MQAKYILPFFLVLQILFLKVIAYFPEWIENQYSNGLYLIIAKISRITFGHFPFSIGDCLYGVLIFFILKWFWRKRKSWKTEWKNNLLTVISFLSVLYFIFHLLWGLNYYREPLFEKMNISRDYSDDDLLAFTKKMIKKTNEIQYQITKNDSLKVIFPYSQETVFEKNLTSYEALAKKHSFFTYKNKSTKKSLFSLPLTYMGFSGYLNPFTNEAQANDLIPIYNFPIVTAHETAHQLGYASESECNFIGFLATIKNKNLYFQYSGYSFALRYCLANLNSREGKTFKILLKTIHPGILKNYQESEDFWMNYQSPIDTAFHAFYDQFLKANQQTDGIDSYSKFLNLLINYELKETEPKRN
ncbi:DUF3810 domain-containing protein [Flavobacterium sp. 7A]|uniref:DUF3810 domain-containing protein n=1 Tax=Flavobacterium sp. 7A TaxID=2940571 RepID=UPI002226A366|nr:DUF3810 domain-containing protein [Flavobacterium sp. 7A]MCW2119277.1 uncharacterized membrane protein (DUF485 family) [Flavobacterium sp. 7A]